MQRAGTSVPAFARGNDGDGDGEVVCTARAAR